MHVIGRPPFLLRMGGSAVLCSTRLRTPPAIAPSPWADVWCLDTPSLCHWYLADWCVVCVTTYCKNRLPLPKCIGNIAQLKCVSYSIPGNTAGASFVIRSRSMLQLGGEANITMTPCPCFLHENMSKAAAVTITMRRLSAILHFQLET